MSGWRVAVTRLLLASVGALVMTLATVDRAASAESRLDRVARTGLLRVCIWPENYAIAYRNPRNGQLQGMDIELARSFARDLDAGISFVETDFVRVVADLTEDRCDIAMFGLAVTPERARRIAFSQPYMDSGLLAVTTLTHPRIERWADLDRAGMVIAVLKDTTIEDYARRNFHRARIVAFSGAQEREDEVQSGRADAFLTNYSYARRMQAFHSWAKVVSPDAPVAMPPFAYGVATGDPAWLDRVNAFVAAIKSDGRLETLAARFQLTPIIAR